MLSGLRNFFFSLFISLAIFGVAAYFLTGYIGNMLTAGFDSPGKVVSEAEETPDDPLFVDDPDGYESLTVLLCGLDNGSSQANETKETDSIIVVNINKARSEFMFTALPCDTKIDVNGFTLRLGMVYSQFDIQTLKECVRVLTGLKIDYYAVADYDGLTAIFDNIGSIMYYVPMDMYYMPPLEFDSGDGSTERREPEINLKMGEQSIDGKKAVQLLRFKGYSNGDTGRFLTARDFIKEVFRQKVTLENILDAPKVFKALLGAVKTDMTENVFASNLDLIFSYSKYTATDLLYPGSFKQEYGNSLFIPDVSGASKLYQTYRNSY